MRAAFLLFLFLVEHPHIGCIGRGYGRVRRKLCFAETGRSLRPGNLRYLGDADILERFLAHEQVQFHFLEELFIHEGVHTFEYFRHGVGEFLQGACLNALKQQEHTDPDAYKNMIMESLQKQIGMKELPKHIECFDNSNIQGTNPVSACVVFRNGVPSKKDYRHFKVKTVVGANDYATMKEVVNRRYSRMLEENPEDIPQLVVIDGGKGQLAFAYEALAELGLTDKLTVIALAERMEEVYRVGDPYPMFIDRNSPALKVLQHIRDEAHRFGISFHRNLRSKSQVESALGSIKGVGPKTEQRLLLHFGSVARIASASLDDVSDLVGPALAERILNALNNED